MTRDQSVEEADRKAIVEVIADYVSVTDNKNHAAIERAFHQTARLLSVGQGNLREMSLDEWWSRVSRITGNVSRNYRVSMLDVEGLAAAARVDFETSSDYLMFLKIGGQWKIVNKILSTEL